MTPREKEVRWRLVPASPWHTAASVLPCHCRGSGFLATAGQYMYLMEDASWRMVQLHNKNDDNICIVEQCSGCCCGLSAVYWQIVEGGVDERERSRKE